MRPPELGKFSVEKSPDALAVCPKRTKRRTWALVLAPAGIIEVFYRSSARSAALNRGQTVVAWRGGK